MIGFIGASRSRQYASLSTFSRTSRCRLHHIHLPFAGGLEGSCMVVDNCWRCRASLRVTRLDIFVDF
jgi:hypothetical protein